MVTIKSNIPEAADAYFRQLWEKVDAAVYRALVRTGLVGEARVKGIVEKEAYDTGRLLRSVTSVIYKNPDLLKKFVTESGKILPRRVTGMPAHMHRKITREIKRSRSVLLMK